MYLCYNKQYLWVHCDPISRKENWEREAIPWPFTTYICNISNVCYVDCPRNQAMKIKGIVSRPIPYCFNYIKTLLFPQMTSKVWIHCTLYIVPGHVGITIVETLSKMYLFDMAIPFLLTFFPVYFPKSIR